MPHYRRTRGRKVLFVNNENNNTLTEVMRDCLIYDAPLRPLKAVAAEISKPYPTLVRELNPDDDAAKLGADLVLPIMRVTGDSRPLDWLASKMGCLLRPASDIHPDRDTWQGEHAQDTARFGEMSRLMDEGASCDAVRAAARELIREVEETCARYCSDYAAVNNAGQRLAP